MPFLILYGGEIVFVIVFARIARWLWRSREQVLALWRERHGAPASGPSSTPDPIAAPEPIPLPRRARRRASDLQRAA